MTEFSGVLGNHNHSLSQEKLDTSENLFLYYHWRWNILKLAAMDKNTGLNNFQSFIGASKHTYQNMIELHMMAILSLDTEDTLC